MYWKDQNIQPSYLRAAFWKLPNITWKSRSTLFRGRGFELDSGLPMGMCHLKRRVLNVCMWLRICKLGLQRAPSQNWAHGPHSEIFFKGLDQRATCSTWFLDKMLLTLSFSNFVNHVVLRQTTRNPGKIP